MSLPGHLTLSRQYDRFIFSRPASQSAFTRTISFPGETDIPELGLEVRAFLKDDQKSEPDETNYFWQAEFDYDKIGSLLLLRNRQSGDWFCPSGMAGKRKKLQDYFVDEKVPRRKRDSVPLLCSGDHILWVVGLRTDERFLTGPETRRILTVTVKNKNIPR